MSSMLDNGIIEPSRSPWSSPIVVVPKKDGGIRFCVDYRQLNSVTIKDAYPLPQISDTLESLAGAKFFSTLDLASGYWQVGMHPDDQHKTAFASHRGLFEFKVLPFGLCNAPATFERLMEFALAGLIGTSCLVYLDDIVVFSRTFEEHLARLREVLYRLRDAGLKVKPSKCFLFRKEIAYLGHVVSAHGISTDPKKTEAIQDYPAPRNMSAHGISTDPKKTEAIQDYPAPRNIQEVRRFVGFASYYRRFIPNFAELAAPLHQLTQKSTKFLWTQQCQDAFQKLKKRFTEAPILAFPHFDAPFILYTDASDYGIGSVLSQKIDGAERVIAYASRQLSKAERHGPTTEKEALAAVWSMKHFRPYLLGHKFTLVTDHQPLKWLKSMKDPPPKIARWIMSLQEYDLQVQYRPGKLHTNADTMSRIPATQEVMPVVSSTTVFKTTQSNIEIQKANANVPVVSSTTVLKPTQSSVEVQKASANIQYIIQWKETNKGIPSDVNKSTLDSEMRNLLNQWDRLQAENGTLLRQWKPAAHSQPQFQIVLTRKQGQEILKELPTGGHLDIKKTAAKVQ